MTENKPYGYAYDVWSGAADRFVEAFSKRDPVQSSGLPYRDVRPLYEHPPAPQSDPDPAVEAARRKALRAIFGVLKRAQGGYDTDATLVSHGLLRDLVGEPRTCPAQVVAGYDDLLPPEHPFRKRPLTPRFEGVRFDGNPNAVNVVMKPQPARLSVDMLASIMANSGSYSGNPNNRFIRQAAKAVHEAVYGKDA